MFTAGMGVNVPAPVPDVLLLLFAPVVIVGAAATLPRLDRLSCCCCCCINPVTLPLLATAGAVVVTPGAPPAADAWDAEGAPDTCTLTSNPAALPLLCSINAFCFCFTANIARTCSNAEGSSRWIVKPITTGEIGVEGPPVPRAEWE